MIKEHKPTQVQLIDAIKRTKEQGQGIDFKVDRYSFIFKVVSRGGKPVNILQFIGVHTYYAQIGFVDARTVNGDLHITFSIRSTEWTL